MAEKAGRVRGPITLATSVMRVESVQSAKYCSRSAPGKMEQSRRAVMPTFAKNVRSLLGKIVESG